MTLREKIEQAFGARQLPTEVIDSRVWQFDSDVEEAEWFRGRNRHELTAEDWRSRGEAIVFFSPEAFAYYLPSVMLLAADRPDVWFTSVDYVMQELDLSAAVEAWDDDFARRFQGLRFEELEAVQEWLLCICEYDAYRGWGISASGPGDRFRRASQTIDALQKKLKQRQLDVKTEE